MTVYEIKSPYPVFYDNDGSPLEAGYIYIGQEGQNPVTHPIEIFWDVDLQYPAAQPVRTVAGSPDRNGSPGQIYSSSPYSLSIKDKNGNIIYSSTDLTTIVEGNSENLLTDGGFQLFVETDVINSPADRTTYHASWIFNSGPTSIVTSAKHFTFDSFQTDVPNNPKYYILLGSTSIVNADDYFKMCHCIEDLFKYVGEWITVSFYAKAINEDTTQISTSFTLKTLDASARLTGYGVKKYDITNTWQKYTHTFQMPDSIDVDPYEENTESCLILNFWQAAGTDYDDETNSLGFPAGSVAIAAVKVERGTSATAFYDRAYEYDFQIWNRQYEKSWNDDIPDDPTGDDGYLYYIKVVNDTELPGFRFCEPKRTTSPTVKLYDNVNGTVDSVYSGGTIAVSSVNNISKFACGDITLGAAIAAGNAVTYHYEVYDYLTL